LGDHCQQVVKDGKVREREAKRVRVRVRRPFSLSTGGKGWQDVQEREAKRESESARAFSLSTGSKGWQGERERGKERVRVREPI